ncbi:MAG: hypothetical protein M1142_03440 [Patescibacteria group bacterium]|nr:hypothetical protein [Patescibacteria group bacterium]
MKINLEKFKYVLLNKEREGKNVLVQSRPEQWFFVLIPYVVGASISHNWNLLVFLFLTFPYNYFVYKLDDILENKYGKGDYEIISAPVYFIIPFILGFGKIDLLVISGLYLWMFGVNATHSIGHKEIRLSWAYFLLPIILLGAYLMSAISLVSFTFFKATFVVGFSHLVLLITKTWRDDYWIAVFGLYVGVGLYEGLLYL